MGYRDLNDRAERRQRLADNSAWQAFTVKLTENMIILAEFYENQPMGVELPSSMTFEVIETEPVMASATKTAMTKPAKLSNGVTVQVPAFINQGDMLRVDPREGKYLERAK